MGDLIQNETKHRYHSGIQRRWLLNIVSWLVALVGLSVVVTFLTVQSYYYSNLRSGMEAKARTASDFFSNYINLSYNEYYQSCVMLTETFEDKNRMEMQFIGPDGGVVASSYGVWAGSPPGTSDITEAMEKNAIAVFSGPNPQTGERILAVSAPVEYSNGEIIGVLRYVTSLAQADRQMLRLALILLLIGAALICMVLLSSRFFIRSILEPVREINTTAQRIAAGSYGAQINTKYDDEIGELAQTINEMSTQIARTEKMQSEFISSVSHELRTPLTAISGWSETLLGAERMNEDDTRRGLLIISREARRLTGMVEELLEFTRIQDGRFTLNMQPCDLRADFEDTVFMYGSRLRQEGIELTYIENDDPIPEITCDGARLRQVFLNILDNAAKHGGEGKRITAAIALEGDEVVITIRDFGPGIPEEELPHVKKKFYKGSSKVRGSGIGLAVCDEIVTRHGGTLDLRNAEGGGTEVIIRLPATENG